MGRGPCLVIVQQMKHMDMWCGATKFKIYFVKVQLNGFFFFLI